MQHTICHKDTSDEIHLNIGIPVVSINNEEINGLDYRDIDLLCFIIEFSPKSLTYGEIGNFFLEKHNVGGCHLSDTITYIRKKKHNIYRLICKKYKLPNLIDTVRSVGYRLNHKWEKRNNKLPHHIVPYLDEIGRILEEVISIQEKTHLIEKKDEDKTIVVLDLSPHEEIISVLQKKYIVSSKKLLWTLSLTPFEYKYIKIESILNIIFSYVSMTRSGSNISHEVWRKLFREELHQHFKMLIFTTQNSQMEQGT